MDDYFWNTLHELFRLGILKETENACISLFSLSTI